VLCTGWADARTRPDPQGEQGHNDATVEHKGQKSLLYGIGNAIGTHPEVKLVGGGVQSKRFGGRVLKQAVRRVVRPVLALEPRESDD